MKKLLVYVQYSDFFLSKVFLYGTLFKINKYQIGLVLTPFLIFF